MALSCNPGSGTHRLAGAVTLSIADINRIDAIQLNGLIVSAGERSIRSYSSCCALRESDSLSPP